MESASQLVMRTDRETVARSVSQPVGQAVTQTISEWVV